MQEIKELNEKFDDLKLKQARWGGAIAVIIALPTWIMLILKIMGFF